MVQLRNIEQACRRMDPPEQIVNIINLEGKTLYISSYHFAVNIYTTDKKHQLDILFGGDYAQFTSRVKRCLKVFKRYNIKLVFFQEDFSSEKSAEEDARRRTATYQKGQRHIPHVKSQSELSSPYNNWHSNVTWLSFCMYQIFKEEGVLLLEHETMENINTRAGLENAIVIASSPVQMIKHSNCQIWLRDFAFELMRKARESSTASKSRENVFRVRLYEISALTRRKLGAIYAIDTPKKDEEQNRERRHDDYSVEDLIDLMSIVKLSETTSKTGFTKPDPYAGLADGQREVLQHLKSTARLSHQLEAVIRERPAIMSSVIDDIRRPSAWQAAWPVLRIVWSMLAYESQHGTDKKLMVKLLDRVQGTDEYKIREEKLKVCNGLNEFLEMDDKKQQRRLLCEVLKLPADNIEFCFDTTQPITTDDATKEEFFVKQNQELFMLAIIYWMRYTITDDDTDTFGHLVPNIIESLIFMALFEQPRIEISGLGAAPVVNQSDDGLFMLHSIAQIRCILAALNQLNRITDSPFDPLDITQWKGNTLFKVLKYRTEHSSMDALFSGHPASFQNNFEAALIAIDHCCDDDAVSTSDAQE